MAAVGAALVGVTATVSFAGTDSPRTVRVSVSSTGQQADTTSFIGNRPASVVSNGGRFVVFVSHSADLAPGGTNGRSDVLLRDTVEGVTTRIGVTPDGVQGDGGSRAPSISADGRYVAFESGATDLVPGDTNGKIDVFVRDVVAGATTRVSVAGAGTQASSASFGGVTLSGNPSISADGRRVAFVSYADNLVPGDKNQHADIFMRDLDAGTTSRVSVGSSGQESDKEGICVVLCTPSLSRDGRYVAFASWATNLVPGDTNNSFDVFVRDVVDGTTTRASVSTDGTQAAPVSASGGELSLDPVMTADGRQVFFSSFAPLVAGDTNGKPDVYVRDLDAGTTTMIKTLVSEPRAPLAFTVSANGRYLGFASGIEDLPGGPNGSRDSFVRDLVTGVSTRVSVSNDGAEGDATSTGGWVSPDGGSVVFSSEATNLVDGDTNGQADIFLHRLSTPEPAGGFPTATATFTLGAATVSTGQQVTVKQVKPAPRAVQRVVDWGDGSALQTLAADATNAGHAYQAAGKYRVQVALVDEGGNRAGALFDGASTVVVVPAASGTFTLDQKAIFATRSVTLGMSKVAGADKLSVAWGDGTTSTPAPTAVKVAHTFAKAGTYPVTVTLSTTAGPAAPIAVGTVTVTKDTVQPVITLTVPRNPGRVASWAKLTGTAADKGLGVASVQVKLIEKRGANWFYYTGSRWQRAASKAVAQSRAAAIAVVPDARGGWSQAVRGVTRGTLTVTYSGRDKAGNTAAAKTVTQNITR